MTDYTARLDHLATLKDNWDGHGSIRVNPKCLSYARCFLARNPEPGKDIMPLPDGGLLISWGDMHDQDGVETEVYIVPPT